MLFVAFKNSCDRTFETKKPKRVLAPANNPEKTAISILGCITKNITVIARLNKVDCVVLLQFIAKAIQQQDAAALTEQLSLNSFDA